jgi:hypothetical protein
LSKGGPEGLPNTFTIDATAYIDAVAYVPANAVWPVIGIPGSETWMPLPEWRRPIGTVVHANWYQTKWEPFHGVNTLDGIADVEEDFTNSLSAGRRHMKIVDRIHDDDMLYDFFEGNMQYR